MYAHATRGDSGGGKLIADSRDVAKTFGKRHTEVIRAVRDMIAKEPELDAILRLLKSMT